MNLKTFEELKLSGNLPTPAGVGMKILQLTRTEDFSAEEMGQAIMSDSSLTGRILKLANTAGNAGAEPATTVSEAIMRLGSRTVRDLALAFSLVSERKAGTCREFDYEIYWSRSLARAVSAQALCRVQPVSKPEEAYICGLLGEVGKLALASVYSEKYGEILRRHSADDTERLLAAEAEQFDIDHSQVGHCMLADWGLPERFADAVARFTQRRRTEFDAPEIEDLADVLRHGSAVADACVLTERTSQYEYARVGDALDRLRAVLGFDKAGFRRFCDTCATEWVAWGESLDVAAEGVRFAQIFERIAEAREAIENGTAVPPVTPESVAASEDDVTEDPVTRVVRSASLAAPHGASTQAERFTILAIDDDPVSLRVLVKHLRNEGYDVEMARGGKEGLKIALRCTPDIIVVDHEMPDLSGLEVVESLRRTDDGGNMYVLLATGREDEELIVEAFDAGADDFITKPFMPRVLSARIKAGIRLARLQRKTQNDRQTIMKQVAELGMLTRKLRSAAMTDTLTELPNRRYAMKRLENEWAATQRSGRPLSVVMLDIDHFKSVNDMHGHDVGDDVLRETARTIRAALREEDEVCRLGGEEFLIIARATTEADCAGVAERVRRAVESAVIAEPGFHRNVTVSLGVATSDSGYASVDELLKASDEAVYAAKHQGRNRVCRASDAETAGEERMSA